MSHVNGGAMRPAQDGDNTDGPGLFAQYLAAPNQNVRPGAFSLIAPIRAVRVPGLPDLILDHQHNPERVDWASIQPDGTMTVHNVNNRMALDHTSVVPQKWESDEHCWYQWTLLMAMYDEALDPRGQCRDAHGYNPERLTWHAIGQMGGYVVEGCHRCAPKGEPLQRNRVAEKMVKSVIEWLNVELHGTVAWLGVLDSRQGEPYGYQGLDAEELGRLSGLADAHRLALYPETRMTSPPGAFHATPQTTANSAETAVDGPSRSNVDDSAPSDGVGCDE